MRSFWFITREWRFGVVRWPTGGDMLIRLGPFRWLRTGD